MTCVGYWIASWWLLLCLAGPKICDSQNSYWVPSYHNRYPIESNNYVPLPSKTYHRHFRPVNQDNYLLKRNRLTFPEYSPSYEYDIPSRDIQQDKQRNPEEEEDTWEEREILEKLDALDKILSDESNEERPEMRNSVDYKIISDSLISEETKRVVRQVRRDKPGFFWTLARLAFETYNDTKSAINQIRTIVSDNIVPDTATQRSTTSDSLMDASKPSSMNVTQVNATTQSTMDVATTTAAPRLTTGQLQSLIRRNVKGLVRLFNIEWQEALKQSDINVEEFRRDLGKEVGRYLQDNPNAF